MLLMPSNTDLGKKYFLFLLHIHHGHFDVATYDLGTTTYHINVGESTVPSLVTFEK